MGHILGVKLSSEDIDIAHRMKIKRKDAPRPIIVRFRNYTAKKNLFKARLKLRNVDLHEIGADKLFINENLTAWRAQLFKETRNVKKIYPNGKAWTIDGKIFLKTDFNSKRKKKKTTKTKKETFFFLGKRTQPKPNKRKQKKK